MNPDISPARSPELMNPFDTALLVVDVQAKLLPLVPGHQAITWNIRRLLDGAEALGVPVFATEQYPKGLGPTTPELAPRLGSPVAKLAFSCATCGEIVAALDAQGRHKVAVVGIEAHVCIQQTVLDLMSAGFRAYVVVDAIGARRDIDCQIALKRMDSCGASLTTTEAALFEWCGEAGTPAFKTISRLVRETPPEGSA
jgi:nicotinamidase-related amidase